MFFGFCFVLFLTVQLSIILWLHYTALSCRLPSYQAFTARIAYIPPKRLSTVTCLDQKMSERNKEHKVERIRCQHSFSSVAQLCPTLCDPMNHSTPGLPVHHHLPEFTQTHVHRVSDAHPAISSSVVPFSSCSQSLPASESFPVSQLFA